MSQPTTIVWFRSDLRLTDNPALRAAADRGRVVPVYIWSPNEEDAWEPGGASKWWLHESLTRLAEQLQRAGSPLVFRKGDALNELRTVIGAGQADAVFWNRRYEPSAVTRDAQIKGSLRSSGIDAKSFNASLLLEPWTISTGSDTPYKVFTPFWRTGIKRLTAAATAPTTGVRSLTPPTKSPHGARLDSFRLTPRPDWAEGIRQTWTPGETGAQSTLRTCVKEIAASYEDTRNTPSQAGTSRLSPHLHFGEIGPRQIWTALQKEKAKRKNSDQRAGIDALLRQLGWREFAYHLLFHFPKTVDQPLREDFAEMPWRRSPKQLSAWQKGKTGYPFVDAGMRELWHTGWMHNRVRMVVASFLVKDLLLDWREGARWFWDTLVDADLPNNTLGWQWTAGCGADAAPFFRVFNPISQGEKFDKDAVYVRHWVPEIAGLPDKYIHKPWTAPAELLQSAGIKLGHDYPEPIVIHENARKDALAAYQTIKS